MSQILGGGLPAPWLLGNPTQVGRTPHKPALPTTQPRAPPARHAEGPPGWQPGAMGARG